MKNKLAVLAALCALFAMVFASPQVIASCRDGLRLCCELILPSLFPFFVISLLLGKLGLPGLLGRLLSPVTEKLFGVSGAGATALILGLTGGYPLGAAYLAELERGGQLRSDELERLLGFCNNSGPAFLVGAVGGGVFASPRLGLLLYGCHVLAALLTGILLRGRGQNGGAAPRTQPTPFSRALPEAVREAIPALLSVCGFVVCFAILTGLLDSFGLLGTAAGWLAARTGLEVRAARALLCGFFELGGGVGAMRGLPATPGHLALAAALVGWGGISVHFQTLAVLADSDAKSALHMAGRLMSAVFGSALAYGLGKLLL